MTPRLVPAAAFAALVTLVAPPASANLLTNGSFEQGPAVTTYLLLSAGSTQITGWTVTRGNVHYCGSGLWQIPNGSRDVDLDGGINGGVRQTFATLPGQAYLVTWKLAGNPASAPAIKTMVLTAAGQQATFTFSTAGKSFANMGYVDCQWAFVADAASTTLELYSTTNPTGFGPVIDMVSVDGTTPAARTSWGRIKDLYRP